jgi:dTDP-4-amino-4,6-dideoxygalactose transaminase
MDIPFHKPFYDDRDEAALLASLRSGKIVGDGENTRKASERLAELMGVRHVLLTTSCTHALELAMMTLDLRPGDEVIVPSFTFVSSTNCILRSGGKVVFADILSDTLTFDPRDVERRITPKTRAIIPVVYAGVAPRMDELLQIARKHSLTVVEDAAQGVGAFYRGKSLGTLGDIGCFSFHETKNYSTGEGGAFVTSSDTFMQRAEIIREKGTNRKQFMLGLVDKYTWVSVGSSYLPPDTVGAMLMSQLDKAEAIQKSRAKIYERYIREFSPLAARGFLTLPVIPPEARSNHHIFHVVLQDEETRNRAIAFFRSRGIIATFHYLPLHLSPVGASLGYAKGDFPVTESVSGRLLRLPIYPALSDEEQTHVINTLKEFLTR